MPRDVRPPRLARSRSSEANASAGVIGVLRAVPLADDLDRFACEPLPADLAELIVFDRVLGEEESLPGGSGQVRAFGRTVLESRMLDLLGDDPADASFGRAMEAYLAQGRHRALLLEGTPVDLGTMPGYRHYNEAARRQG